MVRVRTFIAIDPSADVRRACREVITAMSRESQAVRWVDPDQLHLTMRFLGEVDEREIPMVCQCTQAAALETSRFSLHCRSVGAFPTVARPNTIWAGFDDSRQLEMLHRRVENALDPLGFPSERRRFVAHLTLGRVKSRPSEPALLSKIIQEQTGSDFGMMPVTQLTVYSSELTRTGPRYTVLSQCPLNA